MAFASDSQVDSGVRTKLEPGGIRLGAETLSLFSGSFHYFRHAPDVWRACLKELRELGFRLVDTPVPWNVHELEAGGFDFGTRDPRLNLTQFLRVAHEEGLKVGIRPGPHVGADLAYFGIPKRVIWDDECQARSPTGRPVILPAPPLAFPVPSYGSRGFLGEVRRWYREVARRVAPLRWPDGPLVLVTLDDASAPALRNGLYDQDYHAETLEAYRRFLGRRYATVGELCRAYEVSNESLDTIDPPSAFFAVTPRDLRPHLDWAEFQELHLEDAATELACILEDEGLTGVAVLRNLPCGRGPQSCHAPEAQRRPLACGSDFGFQRPRDFPWVRRRASELSASASELGLPAYATSLSWGFPPYRAPLSQADAEFNVLAALGFGVRGFNVDMAVERDRFIGGILNGEGERKAGAVFWEKLLLGLDRLDFPSLVRESQVSIVLGRSFARLLRVLHAFGPMTAVHLDVLGYAGDVGASETRLLESLALKSAESQGLSPALVEAAAFMKTLETALDEQGIAYGFVPGDFIERPLTDGAWTVVVCPGVLDAGVAHAAERGLIDGRAVTFGPRLPLVDADLCPLAFAPEALRFDSDRPQNFRVPVLARTSEIGALIAGIRQRLGLPAQICSTSGILTALHVGPERAPRALVLMNPGQVPTVAELLVCGVEDMRDVISGEVFHPDAGKFAVPMPGQKARLLDLTATRGGRAASGRGTR